MELNGIPIIESMDMTKTIQTKFPRSKRKRIRKKFAKKFSKQVPDIGSVLRTPFGLMMHPITARQLREEFKKEKQAGILGS